MRKKHRNRKNDHDNVKFQESIKIERNISEQVYNRIRENLISIKCTNKSCIKDPFEDEMKRESPYSFAKLSSMPKDILFFRSYNSWCCLEYESEIMRAYYKSIRSEIPNSQDKDDFHPNETS